MPSHTTTRLRHETRRPTPTAAGIAQPEPRMRRIGFTGDELHAFFSASPDDHVMLLFDTEGAPTPPTKHAMTDRFARGPGAC